MRRRLTLLPQLTIVLLAIGAAAAVILGLLAVSGQLPGSGAGYRVRAVVPSAAGIAPGARVTMAGARVGRVTAVRRQGVGAVLDLRLDDDGVVPLPRGSQVAVRQRTPVGETYVSIAPGRDRAALPEDGVLTAQPDDVPVDVDEVLTVLQGRTRNRARELLRATGSALRGRGDELHRLLGGTNAALGSAADVIRVAARDRRQVRDIVVHLGRLADAVAERGAAIDAVARDGLRTVRAVADRDEAVRRTLRDLPPALRQVRATTGTLGRVSDDAAPVLSEAAAAVREVRPAVRRLVPAAAAGTQVVRELDRVAPPLTGTLERLRAAAPGLDEALPRLRTTLCQLNPMLRYVRPYAKDFMMVFQGLGSASNAYDAIGHTIRLLPIVGENSLAGLPPEVSQAAFELLHSGLLGETVGPLNWNPYPKPGTIGRNTAVGTPHFSGPEDFAARGGTFTRVQPDC